MKKVKKFPLLLISLMGFILLTNYCSVVADITNVSVTPQIDTGDTDKFEMVVKPGEKRSLTIAFTNFGSAVERLAIQPTNAQTDPTGNFVYNEVVKKGTAGLQVAFADMTKRKTITLQPQESKTETLIVNTPNERFDGVVYGGLSIFSVNASGNHHNSESTPIPVIMTQTNENVPGNGKITGIEPKAIGFQPNIVIKLENQKPGEAKNVSYNLMIQRKGMFSFLGFNGRKVPIYQSDLSIAPNSILPIPVNYKQQPLTPGEYMLTGSYTVNGKTKKVNETYKVSKNAAEKVNKQSKGLIYDKTWIFVSVIIGLIVLIGFVVFLIVRQIRYNRREENNRLVAQSEKLTGENGINPDPLAIKKGKSTVSYGQSNVIPNNNQRPLTQNYNNYYSKEPNGVPNNNFNYDQQGNFKNQNIPNGNFGYGPQQPNYGGPNNNSYYGQVSPNPNPVQPNNYQNQNNFVNGQQPNMPNFQSNNAPVTNYSQREPNLNFSQQSSQNMQQQGQTPNQNGWINTDPNNFGFSSGSAFESSQTTNPINSSNNFQSMQNPNNYQQSQTPNEYQNPQTYANSNFQKTAKQQNITNDSGLDGNSNLNSDPNDWDDLSLDDLLKKH